MIRKKLNVFCHSLYFKVMALFLLVIIPLFLLGISIYLWGYDMVRKEIINSSISQVNLYSQTIEDEISRIQKLQYEFVNDEDLLYLTNAFEIMDNFERSQYMIRIQHRLDILRNSSIFMEDIVVHIPRLGKTISSSNGVEPLHSNWDSTIANMYHADSSGLTYKNNQLLMDISYPLILREEKTPLIMVEISLSNQPIIELLNGFSQYKDSTFFIVNQDNTYLLATNSKYEISDTTLNHIKENPFGTFSYSFGEKPCLIAYTHLPKLQMQLISIVPTHLLFGKIQEYKIFFLCFIIALFIVIILFTILIRLWIHKPFNYLINAIKEVQSGNLNVVVHYENQDEFQYLYQSFNNMIHHIDELIHQVYEQKLLTQRSELKQLQSQINPHFLYNSFFNIYRMAKDEDYKNIVTFTYYLGNYYQYITKNAHGSVCLSDEYDNARLYLNIQGMRFQNTLKFTMDNLPSSIKSILVPRLIIQPVIENAFEHGLKTVEQPEIRVTCMNTLENILISVEDNGPSLNTDQLEILNTKLHCYDMNTEITGLINIHRRLQLYFNSNSGIAISISDLGGLKVTICIPVIGGGEHE